MALGDVWLELVYGLYGRQEEAPQIKSPRKKHAFKRHAQRKGTEGIEIEMKAALTKHSSRPMLDIIYMYVHKHSNRQMLDIIYMYVHAVM